jgi:hypothetical protein
VSATAYYIDNSRPSRDIRSYERSIIQATAMLKKRPIRFLATRRTYPHARGVEPSRCSMDGLLVVGRSLLVYATNRRTWQAALTRPATPCGCSGKSFWPRNMTQDGLDAPCNIQELYVLPCIRSDFKPKRKLIARQTHRDADPGQTRATRWDGVVSQEEIGHFFSRNREFKLRIDQRRGAGCCRK